ncbi:MAG: hypothetical protein U0V04_12955 [Spirosomataceae bacterium]|jgi:hypothetical protein|nr:hypothetical protein [Bacteroidota bacterium]
MKNPFKIFLGVVFLITLLNACKKKEEVEVIKTNKQYLTGDTSKRWKLSSGKANFKGDELDLMIVQSPCITDNILVLSADFKYQITEGAQKCKPTDPDILIAGNWVLSEDQKKITIDKFIVLDRVIDKASFEISEINDKKFVGKTDVTISGNLVNMNITFEAVDNI